MLNRPNTVVNESADVGPDQQDDAERNSDQTVERPTGALAGALVPANAMATSTTPATSVRDQRCVPADGQGQRDAAIGSRARTRTGTLCGGDDGRTRGRS
jgi:hypothetical protein